MPRLSSYTTYLSDGELATLKDVLEDASVRDLGGLLQRLEAGDLAIMAPDAVPYVRSCPDCRVGPEEDDG